MSILSVHQRPVEHKGMVLIHAASTGSVSPGSFLWSLSISPSWAVLSCGRIRESWVLADWLFCGPRNTGTLITSQPRVREVARLSKAAISSHTILSSLLALVPRGGWRALIIACWLHSRTGALTPLKTCQKVKKLLTKEVTNGHSGNLASSTMPSPLFKASPWS